MKTLEYFFQDRLAEMHCAEKQLAKALTKMAKAATHGHLRASFEDYLAKT
jgi:ferritin-like metal-binding protein YciE